MRELSGEACVYEHTDDFPDTIYDSARAIRMDDYPYTDSVGLVDPENNDGFFSGVYPYKTWLEIRELDEFVTAGLIGRSLITPSGWSPDE